MRTILQHLRSNVVAYLALFTAMGGTSYAAVNLPASSVTSREIKARSVHLSDLASDARPSSKSKLFRAAVTDVVLDPGTQAAVDAIAGAVKGEKGDKGDPIVGPQGASGSDGASGPQGSQGAAGPRGAALGFAHVSAGGIVDAEHTSPNAVVVRPGGPNASTLECVKATDGTVKNVAVSLDTNGVVGGETIATRVPPGGSTCDGYDFEVTVIAANGTATTRGLFLTLN